MSQLSLATTSSYMLDPNADRPRKNHEPIEPIAIGMMLKRAAGGTGSKKMQAYVAGSLATMPVERARGLQS